MKSISILEKFILLTLVSINRLPKNNKLIKITTNNLTWTHDPIQNQHLVSNQLQKNVTPIRSKLEPAIWSWYWSADTKILAFLGLALLGFEQPSTKAPPPGLPKCIYYWCQRNRKPDSENKFWVICVLLKSLDYALMLACVQATLMLMHTLMQKNCEVNRMQALHFW